MSVLLLVESNTTGTGRKFARRAVALGVEPVLICADPDRYPYAVQDGVRQVVADTADEAAVLAAARELGRRSEIAGVTSSSEYYVPCAAATAAATLPVETERHIMECATAAVRAVRMTWGAVHVELRLGRDGPRIIEVNPRPAGGRIPDLVRAALGMDLIDAQVRAALGDIADVEWHGVTDFASIRFLTAPRRAVVADPELAVTAALDVAGVIDAALARTRNECLEPAVDFRGRAGHVVAVAGDAHSAAGAAERGLELLGRALHPARTVEAR
jgi:biotin carboxylase